MILGQKVFEWDQTLDEVNIYIALPPNVHSKQFYCKIQSKHLELGIKGNPPYLNVTLIYLHLISFLIFSFFVFYFGGCLILPPLVVPSFVYLYFFSFIHCSYRGISLLLLFVCLLFDFIIVPHFPFFFCGQFLIMFLNS